MPAQPQGRQGRADRRGGTSRTGAKRAGECDGLTGLPEAIEATWPQATVQTCVVHLIRAATRFVSYSDRKAVAAALRPIYQAPSEEAAWEALETFEASELGTALPGRGPDLHRLLGAIHSLPGLTGRWCDGSSLPHFVGGTPSTNAIEAASYQLRKVTRNRGHFPSDEAAVKLPKAGYLQHPWTRQPDNGKRSSTKDGPARARPPAD